MRLLVGERLIKAGHGPRETSNQTRRFEVYVLENLLCTRICKTLPRVIVILDEQTILLYVLGTECDQVDDCRLFPVTFPTGGNKPNKKYLSNYYGRMVR